MFDLLQPEYLINLAGLTGIWAIIFAESGLFFGFFFPGDSLLFTAGLLASQGYLDITWLVLGGIVAAIAGDSVGYWFGRKIGPVIFSREDSLLFHKKHVISAKNFYDKHGPKAIVLARFIPIIRTFAPIVAGVGVMNYRTFLTFNILGGVLWVGLATLAGYFLGLIFPATEKYLNLIIFLIIFSSFIPIIFEWLKNRKAIVLK